jgi:hypothetical protein
MNKLLFAEEILNRKKCNQWFVQFFKDHNGLYDEATKSAHFQWFTSHLVTAVEVTSVGAMDYNTGFFHVNFVDADDVRLQMYQRTFEDSEGTSLSPSYYQMYEWDYNHWVERGGPLEFNEALKNKTV